MLSIIYRISDLSFSLINIDIDSIVYPSFINSLRVLSHRMILFLELLAF